MAASAAASRSPTGRPARAAAACVSVRVIAREFRPTRSMRRVADRNADIVGEMRARGADLGAIFGVPRLSRFAPPRRRHGRHDGARLRHDGRGQPRRDAASSNTAGAGPTPAHQPARGAGAICLRWR